MQADVVGDLRRPSAGRARGTADELTAPAAKRRRYVPLLYRVAVLNVVLMLVAVGVTVIVLSPSRVSSFALDEEVAAIAAAVAVVVLANVYVLRRLVGPVHALTELARRVDLDSPGARMPDAEPASEAGELALTFNEMLDRLQAERREATARILAAQEAERLRVARELHDQIGQALTAVLLGLGRLRLCAPSELEADLLSVQDGVRGTLEDVRRVALELRPEALDDLGLPSALAVLGERFSARLGVGVTVDIDSDLPPLAAETELVVYRVAQEALTNVARHSGATAAMLTLRNGCDRLTLTVRDRGLGLPADGEPGTGIRGMRERAKLIGASLEVRDAPEGAGCLVRLEVPTEGSPRRRWTSRCRG